MRVLGKAALAAALIALPVAAHAEDCWSAEQAAAASLREYQTMLMVSTLRCEAAGMGIAADYNAFVAARRPALEAANGVIKARFRAESGPLLGQAAYDRFTTALANAYGAGATNAQDCARAGEMMRSATAVADDAALLSLARQALFGTAVPVCAVVEQPVALAAAAPTDTPPAIRASIAR